MTDPTLTVLERVKELDKKSTEGPWVLGVNDSDGNRKILSLCHDCWPPCQYEGVRVATSVEADSELISEYRTTAPQLARALEAVLEVHHDQYGDCAGCLEVDPGAHAPWPCPTVRAITEHLGGVL